MDNVGIHRIVVGFDEAVTVPADAVRVWTVGNGDVGIAEQIFDRATKTLTIELNHAIVADIVTVVVDYSIKDGAGNALDGEILSTSPMSLPSGDGLPGGRAVFRYEALQGDANRDGIVDHLDANAIRDSLGQSVGSPDFDPLADLNRDDVVNVIDVAIFTHALGFELPVVDGVPPTIAAITPDPSLFVDSDLDSITLAFSEQIDPNRIDSGDLFVTGQDATLHTASAVSLSPDMLSAEFVFTPPLSRCNQYRLNVSNAITDPSGMLTIRPTPMPVLNGLRPPPAPSIIAFPSLTSQQIETLTGTVDDAAQVRVFGRENVYIVPVVDGQFSVDVDLPANTVSTIFAAGVSTCGTIGPSSSVQIIRDIAGPMINVDFPSTNQQITTDSVTVLGRVGDELAGAEGIAVQINGVPAQVTSTGGNNGSFVAMNVPLTSGVQDITIVATDVLGNRHTEIVSVERVSVDQGIPTITVVSGDGQFGPVLAELPEPLVVALRRPDGMPLVNKLVTFQIERNDGRLAAGAGQTDSGSNRLQVFTDTQGIARVYWGLGSTAGAGANRMNVVSEGLVGTTYFCATGYSKPAAQIHTAEMNNQRGESGSPLPQPIVAYVTDGDAGNPISGELVTFTVTAGDGVFLNGEQVITASTGNNGRASVSFILGENASQNTIEATFAGNPSLPAVFRAMGIRRIDSMPTTFSGVVLDNANRPIGGADATLTLVLDFETGPEMVSLGPIQSDIEGRFTFDSSILPSDALNTVLPGGPAKLLVSGVHATSLGGQPIVTDWTFPYVGYDIVLVENGSNTLPDPVWLPELDPTNEVVYDGSQDVVLTVAGIEGLEFRVKAGSMTREDGTRPSSADPEIIRLNQVHFDELPMPLPNGNAYPFAWTLQPKNARFDPPVEVTLPNLTALPAGSIAEILQWNNDVAAFQPMGTGLVSSDGAVLKSETGSGITVAGWGGAGPPPDPETETMKCPTPQPNGCTVAPDVWSFGCIGWWPGLDCILPGPCYTIDFNAFACGQHDLCYGSCDGPSRPTCDIALLNNLQSACDYISGDLCAVNARINCYDMAYTYYIGVRAGGFPFFADARAACDDCMDGLLPPSDDLLQRLQGTFPPPFADSDIDGIDDNWEIANGLDPNDPFDAIEDFDGDGLRNIAEFLFGSSPLDQFSIDSLVSDGDLLWATQPSPSPGLDEDWEVRSEGRTTAVTSNGAFTLTLPSSQRLTRLTGFATKRNQDLYWATEYFELQDNATIDISDGTFRDTPFPTPTTTSLTAPMAVTTPGSSQQLALSATMSDGSSADITLRQNGTTYVTSSSAVVDVSPNGELNALSHGVAFISATNEGTTAARRITVTDSVVSTTVTGSVLLPDGSPAIGAFVSSPAFGGSAVTNNDGSYNFNLTVPDGTQSILIQATLTGFTPTGVPGIAITPNAYSDAGIVQLTPVFNGVLFSNQRYRAGNGTSDVTTADFNNDGHLDIATTNFSSDNVSVLLNNSDGTFGDPVNRTVLEEPINIVSADFDNDGDIDLAIAHTDAPTFSDDRVGVLLNFGDGTFSAPSTYLVGERLMGLVASDVDGDGDIDLAGVNEFDDTITILRNRGNATFLSKRTYTVPNANRYEDCVFADFDNDGDQDLVIVAFGTPSSTSIYLVPNNGDGTFGTAIGLETGSFNRVEAADFNADGLVDVVATDTNIDSVLVFINTGNNTFNAPFSVAATGRSPYHAIPIDVDNDGNIDIVATDVYFDTTIIIRNLGGAVFDSPQTIDSGDHADGFTAGDLNGDGYNDLVFANSREDNVNILFNDSSGLFQAPPAYPAGELPQDISAMDYDQDGDIDIAVSNRFADTISILSNNSDGVYMTVESLAPVHEPAGIAWNDIDEDGLPDLLVANNYFGSASGTLSVFRNIGNGIFTSPYEIFVLDESPFKAGRPYRFALADVNNDGSTDLAVANIFQDDDDGIVAGSARLLINNGDGSSFVPLVIDGIMRPTDVSIADLDGDGNADLVWADESNGLLIQYGDGKTHFDLPMNILSAGRISSVAIADLDGDNSYDIVAVSGSSTYVLLNTGDRTFAQSVPYLLGISSTDIVANDLDRDGDLDLCVVSTGNGISILYNDGSGTFQNPQTFTAGGSIPTGLAVQDFDNDGDNDIAASNYRSGTVSILQNRLVSSRGRAHSPNFLKASTAGISTHPSHSYTNILKGGSAQFRVPPSTSWSFRATQLESLTSIDLHQSVRNSNGQSLSTLNTDKGDVAAIVSSDGTITPLGTLGGATSQGLAMNESGQVVGWSQTISGEVHAFRYTPGVGMQDLGTLGGTSSVAWDLNESGDSVGASLDSDGTEHPFLYSDTLGIAQLYCLDGYRAKALAISDNELIIGTYSDDCGNDRALAWAPLIGFTDLNTALPGNSSWVLQSARRFADDGSILGTGLFDGQETNFRMEFEIKRRGDINGDGTIDQLDLMVFLNDLSSGDDRSDLNGDGVTDIVDFQSMIEALRNR